MFLQVILGLWHIVYTCTILLKHIQTLNTETIVADNTRR